MDEDARGDTTPEDRRAATKRARAIVLSVLVAVAALTWGAVLLTAGVVRTAIRVDPADPFGWPDWAVATLYKVAAFAAVFAVALAVISVRRRRQRHGEG